MNKYRTLVVDDELHGRENLKLLLARHCPEIEISGEAASAAEAETLISQVHPDLVFLDILMPHANGFDLLGKFPGRRFGVIFVTASMEFGIRAVKAGVIDYLLKPISIHELRQAVDKAVSFLASGPVPVREISKIALAHANGFTMEDIGNIVRLQADDNYTRVFTVSGRQYLISRPLKDFERTLPEGIFVRTHKSYMINIHHLKDYSYEDGGTAVLQDGFKVPVSKRKNSYVLGALRKFSLMLKP
jgi:two-component system LytT family response regulator